MTVNNIDQIKDLITGRAKEGEFFFLQFLKRRKDNPGMKKDMIVIDTMIIDDEEDLENKKDRIIEICTLNNARAYIHLNKRNTKKIALQTLRIIADSVASENYHIRNAFNSACGQYHSDEDKTWIVDIDGEKEAPFEMMAYICHECRPYSGDKIVAQIPTKNGIHLITKPFNRLEFSKEYPNVDIHTDNPTILYIP